MLDAPRSPRFPAAVRSATLCESLRATATTARFLAVLPPHPAIFSPWRVRSEASPKDPSRTADEESPGHPVALLGDARRGSLSPD